VSAAPAARSGLSEAAAPGSPVLDAETVSQSVALATFDAVWTRIRDTYYDSAMTGIDWAGARSELRPRAARAVTLGELRVVVDSLLARLGQSHNVLIPREVADGVADDSAAGAAARAGEPGDVGLSLRLLGGEVVVSEVEPGGPAARAGVHAGWLVDSVETFSRRTLPEVLGPLRTDAERRQAALRVPRRVEHALDGAAGSSVRVAFRDAADRLELVDMVRRPAPGTPVKLGNLPAMIARLSHERVAAPGGGCVGVIRFNLWMAPLAADFDRAMNDVRACRGVVLDLRGNPGGLGGMVMGVGGYFLDRPVPLGVMRTRGTELRFVANPRFVNDEGAAVRPFAGPLAILVDPLSGSTSEIFAAGMQAIGRARLFGETSAGQALPAVMFRLPNGDVLMHAIADFTAPDGRRIEGRGAVPDEVVPATRADLLAGRDAALAAALGWVDHQPPRGGRGTAP
jgi:carboxyl-terminal processing protease